MTQPTPLPDHASRRHWPAAAPHTALPATREDRRGGAALALLFHLLLIYFIVAPVTFHHPIQEIPQGAGGASAAGGGGGGHGGTGGQTLRSVERIRYVALAAAPTPAPPAVSPPTVKPPPVLPPVPVKPTLTPELITAAPTIAAPALKPLDVASTLGTGGGTGTDGTNGNGPGRGGGVGSGVGTGRGAGVGAGTGGGTQANFPPQPIEVFLPPYPIPDNVKGFHLVAEFDVDSTGRVLSMDFTPTPNRGYNRRLQEVFRGFRFRPGTTPAGVPIRMKAQVVVDLY